MRKDFPADLGDNKADRHATRASEQSRSSEAEKQARATARLRSLPAFKLEPHELQPLDRHADENVADLVASIRAIGLQEPPLVRRIDKRCVILAGHRRVRAWQLLASAGVVDQKIRVFVHDAISDAQAAYIIAAEYAHRREFRVLHTARVIGRAYEERRLELGREPTVREMTALVPWSKSSIAQYVRINQALDNPSLAPLVHRVDKPDKTLLYNILTSVKFPQDQLLETYAAEGSPAVKAVLATAETKSRAGRPAQVVTQEHRGDGCNLTIRYRPGMSVEDAEKALTALEEVREQLLEVVNAPSKALEG